MEANLLPEMQAPVALCLEYEKVSQILCCSNRLGKSTVIEHQMRLITILFCWALPLALYSAQGAQDQPLASGKDTTLITTKHTNHVTLAQGGNEASIAKVTATILEHGHYLKQPFN